jgi:biotin transport system substrate-specific component
VDLHLSAGGAIALGVTPFLIGDALKTLAAMGLLPTAWKLVGPGAERPPTSG